MIDLASLKVGDKIACNSVKGWELLRTENGFITTKSPIRGSKIPPFQLGDLAYYSNGAEVVNGGQMTRAAWDLVASEDLPNPPLTYRDGTTVQVGDVYSYGGALSKSRYTVLSLHKQGTGPHPEMPWGDYAYTTNQHGDRSTRWRGDLIKTTLVERDGKSLEFSASEKVAPEPPAKILPITPEAIAAEIIAGRAPHAFSWHTGYHIKKDDPHPGPCSCVLCSLPRGAGWGEAELARRIETMGREAHLSLMAVATFATKATRGSDLAGLAVRAAAKVMAATLGSLLFLVACGGVAEDPYVEASQEPPAATAPVDGGAPPACTPGNGGLCGDQHSTCQGFAICDSRGQWGPCVLPAGCK